MNSGDNCKKEVKMAESVKGKSRAILEKLKAQESRPQIKLESYSGFTPERREQRKQVSEQKIEAKSIYQSKVETILNKMADREYKMKNGSDYFTHYWDYKKLENDLLAAIQEMEKFDDKQLPPSLKSKIEAKKISIEKNQELEKRKNAPPKGTFNPENLDR